MKVVNPVMPKLSQILAIEKGLKERTNRAVTDLMRKLQSADLFAGISRTYRSKDEDGDLFPAESGPVRENAELILKDVSDQLTKLWDLVLTKDAANLSAKADIKIDGQPIAFGVPVTNLLFLEKQLTDLRTIITKAPTLPTTEVWHFDETRGMFATEEAETHRTKKIKRNHVKAAATDKHPAQVEVYDEDIIVGYWTKISYSLALAPPRRAILLERVEKLLEAVKFAREEANSAEVQEREIGTVLFEYLLA